MPRMLTRRVGTDHQRAARRLIELAEERQRILTAFPELRDYVLPALANRSLRKRPMLDQSPGRILVLRLGGRQRAW
jgi:hypothetical protein